MTKLPLTTPLIALLIPFALFVVGACGGDDDGGAPASDSGTPASAAATTTSTPDRLPGPASTLNTIGPPFEVLERVSGIVQQNYRENPDYALPDAATLDSLPEDLVELQPEANSCPDDWMLQIRPGEGFTICFPADWALDGQGFVTAGADDRWYAVGIFKREASNKELAHISIYAMTPGTVPFLYVKNCNEPVYAVELEGVPTTVCPDSYDRRGDEAEMVAYHVRFDEIELFVTAVIKQGTGEDVRAIALQIVRTIDLNEPTGIAG